MKILLYICAAVATLCAATACSRTSDAPADTLDMVEEAFDEGRYANAQALADSLVSGSGIAELDSRSLCRLSLALMKLGENTGEPEVNTAFAARCLMEAFRRDSDSTAIYIHEMNNEDRARMLLLNSINEGSRTMTVEEDQVYEE